MFRVLGMYNFACIDGIGRGNWIFGIRKVNAGDVRPSNWRGITKVQYITGKIELWIVGEPFTIGEGYSFGLVSKSLYISCTVELNSIV